jgi:homoserine dehydrogenase
VDDRLPLSRISGVLNTVEVTGARLGSAIFSGPGAGGDPTAVAVVADILNAALWRIGSVRLPSPSSWGPPGSLAADEEPSEGHRELDPEMERYPFYLRFFVKDQPGIVASIAKILASHEINIDSVLQERWTERSSLPFIISIDPAPYPRLERAMAEIGQLSFHTVPPLALPILRE